MGWLLLLHRTSTISIYVCSVGHDFIHGGRGSRSNNCKYSSHRRTKSTLAHEIQDLPKALTWCIPIAGVAGLFFIIPICATLPPLLDVLSAPQGQGLPYVFHTVMGSAGGGLALMFFVLVIAVFCSISITTAASRCTWAFARDGAIPMYSFWAKVAPNQSPINALILLTIVQMLLGLIDLGNPTAFTAFASVGTIALAVSYAIPIAVSMAESRRAVSSAHFHFSPTVGWTINVLAIIWVAFELILFSMPVALPVTLATMNWASLVFAGFMFLSMLYYVIWARRSKRTCPRPMLRNLANVLQTTKVHRSLMGCKDRADAKVQITSTSSESHAMQMYIGCHLGRSL